MFRKDRRPNRLLVAAAGITLAFGALMLAPGVEAEALPASRAGGPIHPAYTLPIENVPAAAHTPAPPSPSAGASLPPQLALRVSDLATYRALQPWLGKIRFIFYADTNGIADLVAAGAGRYANFGVLTTCDKRAVKAARDKRAQWQKLGVTYIMLDCERGPDDDWSRPNLIGLTRKLMPEITGFRLQQAIQYGYLENGPHCNGKCPLASSHAGQSWALQNKSAVPMVFGRGAAQTTSGAWNQENNAWVTFFQKTYPNRAWWSFSLLTDKDRNGVVDIDPQVSFKVAQEAVRRGASAIAPIYLGKGATAITGPQTRLDVYLNLWAATYPMTPASFKARCYLPLTLR